MRPLTETKYQPLSQVNMTIQFSKCDANPSEQSLGEILEYVVIAMHCNLRPPDAALVLIRFNFDAHAKSDVAQPLRCRIIAFYR